MQFLEDGQWEVNLRLYIPGKPALAIGAGVRVRINHLRSGTLVGEAMLEGGDDGWSWTANMHAVFDVEANDYIYVETWARQGRGSSPLSQSEIGDEYTELSVRQLSRVGQPDIPTDYLQL